MENEKSIKKPVRRGIYLIPNLFTVGALFAGFYAIVAASKHSFEHSVIAIFVAMILDALDGRIARLTHTQSAFGAEMDNLSDMVCFGVTPSLVLYNWSLAYLGKPGWLIAFFYCVCTMLRLARFSSQAQSTNKRYFLGLSTTAAAGVVASLIWVCVNYGLDGQAIKIPVAVFAVAIGLLKVSLIRYRSFKDFDLRNQVPFVAIVLIALVLMFISFDPPDVLLGIFGLYAASGPVTWLWQRARK